MRKIKVSCTSDLPEFLDKELMTPLEKFKLEKEAKERREKSGREMVKRHNAAHPDSKRAYVGELGGAKVIIIQKLPFVIGSKDYSIVKERAFPIYDSDCMRIGNGFAFEINELERVDKDNVFEIYERDINAIWKHVDGEPGNVWVRKEKKNHINPVPKNPVSRFFKKRRLLKEYNNMNPSEKENLETCRKTVKTNDFLAVNSSCAKNKTGSDGWHYMIPRRLSRAVIEDMMWGDKGPYFEANIVPQLKMPARELVNYPMIDFGEASVFKDYPKGLEGKKMREKEALDFKLGHLPCAVYNYMDRNGVIDEMRRSIDDKYEQIRIARNSKR